MLTVDYAVWGALRQTVYHQQSVSSVVELKRAIIVKAWQKHGRSCLECASFLYDSCHLLDGTTLFSKVDVIKLRRNVHNEVTFICAKFGTDLITISKDTGHKILASFFGLSGTFNRYSQINLDFDLFLCLLYNPTMFSHVILSKPTSASLAVIWNLLS